MEFNYQTILIGVCVIILLYYIYTTYFSSDEVDMAGIYDATKEQTISSNEMNKNGITSYDNTYSIWVYVDNWNYNYGKNKVVLQRNNDLSVAFDANVNNLLVSVAYSGSSSSTSSSPYVATIQNIPLQKWVNIILTKYNRSYDVYIDGKLVQTFLVPGVPLVNSNSNVTITPNGGFSGKTAAFKFIPNSINPSQAYNIYSKGYSSGLFGSSNMGLKMTYSSNGDDTTIFSV